MQIEARGGWDRKWEGSGMKLMGSAVGYSKNTKMTLFGLLEYLCVQETLATVQINSNLTLARVSLAET